MKIGKKSMPINRLILIIEEQSIVQVCVIIDCHRLASIVIDCRYQSINWHRLSSIININRLIGIDFLPIFIYWLLLLIGFIFSQDFQRHSLLMHFNDENNDIVEDIGRRSSFFYNLTDNQLNSA